MRPRLRFALASAALSFALGACGNGTNASPAPVEPFVAGLAGAGGGTATSQFFIMPADPRDGSGLPPAINDPGPGKVDESQCAPAGYEFAFVDTFEASKASKTYSYNDSTSEVFPLVSKDWEPPSTTYPAEWTQKWGTPSCGPGSANDTQVLHIAGVYSDFGAGLGTALFNHTDTLAPHIKFADLSQPVSDAGVVTPVDPPARPIVFYAKDHSYVPGLMSADLSAWEGITFWARRGPFAGPGFRPGLLDRTTSDDFNKQLPADRAACRSVYTKCSCSNERPCTHWSKATDPHPTQAQMDASVEPLLPDIPEGYFCWDPKLDAWPAWDPTLRCGQTACDYYSNTPIPSMTYNPVDAAAANLWSTVTAAGQGINTMSCSPRPYVFHDSTTPAANYCYRPGIDLDPPEKMQRCNDGFLGSVLLDPIWRRYFVPFADLRQGSIDKHSFSGIDLGMVETLIFAFPGGNMDVWLDDVAFYRKTK